MSAEIYYFSGTGNSLFVAKELQKRIPDSVIIPIVGLLSKDTIHTKGKTVGFVFPVHALTIPIAVKKFIRKLEPGPSEYIFAIATRQGTTFRGFEKIDRMLKSKKKRLDSHFIINMYNNESRHEGYKVPEQSDILSLEKAALGKLDWISQIINSKAASREKDTEYTAEYLYSTNPIINSFFERLVISGMAISEYTGGVNYFCCDSKCTGCGICEKVCLSQKIKMVDMKPVWQKDVLCYMCFACLNFCPKSAVQINDIPGVKSYSRENGRYTHPYATVGDISLQKENDRISELI